MRAERFVILGVVLALGGCASAAVQRGALIGAGTGAVLGVGTGVLITDDSLLGTRESKARGDLHLETGSTIIGSAIVGTVFGALVGAMVGKVNDYPDVPPDDSTSSAAASGKQLAPSAF